MKKQQPTDELGKRIAERERASRRVRWRKILILGSAATLATGVAWAVFFAPFFTLEKSQISIGTDPGVVDLVAVHAVALERVGTPLTRISTSAIVAEVEAIPTVESAEAIRVWPHGLTIMARARVPVAAVPGEGGVHLFDVHGVDMGLFPAPPAGVPTANVPLSDDTALLLDDISAVMGSLPAELRGQIVSVSAGSPDTIQFELTSGTRVLWGGNSENALKAAVLQTMMLQVPSDFYDVSSPRSPITR